MKHLRILFTASFILSLIVAQSLLSQQTGLDKKLPVHNKIRKGTLQNGLTYYIRHNKRPENRVEMRLVVNAGSVLEDDGQEGLAHFVEHMAFNGTKNFEKNELTSYLQSVGVRFGPDINAYTSFDETVYKLSLPSDSTEIINNAYRVMEDWAHNLLFDHEEIDKERGVIMEEWRRDRGAMQRMRDKFIPVLLKGSRYAVRLPMGDTSVIKNFEYETIKNFYTDWYRPDLMAFIVVGDIDPDESEQKIREHFGNIPVTKNPKERKLYPVPDHEKTLAVVTTDKEAGASRVVIYHKHEPEEEKTYADYLKMVTVQLISGMINERLSEYKNQAEPPFIMAESMYGGFGIRTKEAYLSVAIVAPDNITNGLKTLLTENQRAKLHGFTQTELDRQKKKLINFYERAYNERDKSESANFADEYARNYLTDEPIPGIEIEYEIVKNYLPDVTLEEVNDLVKDYITTQNRVVSVMAPDKENVYIPGEDRILEITDSIDHTTPDPYADKISGTTLMESIPDEGRLLFRKNLDKVDALQLKLGNGMKVVLKKTDFKNDEILVSAFSEGGHSVYPEEDHQSAINAANIITESGLGKYSRTELNKLLTGKTVSISPSIDYYSEGFKGQAAPKDLETLFQLIYLYFNDIRKDSIAFLSYINRQKALLENKLDDPESYFIDRYIHIVTNDHPRANYYPSEEDLNRVDLDRSIEIFKDRFADPAGFTFYFTGAFDMDTIQKYIKTYLASLGGIKRDETWKDLNIRPPSETVDKNVYKGTDPKSIVLYYYEQEKMWDVDTAFLLTTLGKIIRRKYIDIIREEMSGAYTLNANAGLNKIPYSHAYIQIYIPCSPHNADSLSYASINIIEKIKENGVEDEDITKAMEINRREREKALKTNGFWINRFKTLDKLGLSYDEINRFDKKQEMITSENLQHVANNYLKLDAYIRVVLYPEDMKE